MGATSSAIGVPDRRPWVMAVISASPSSTTSAGRAPGLLRGHRRPVLVGCQPKQSRRTPVHRQPASWSWTSPGRALASRANVDAEASEQVDEPGIGSPTITTLVDRSLNGSRTG